MHVPHSGGCLVFICYGTSAFGSSINTPFLTAAVCFIGEETAEGSSDPLDSRPVRGAQCIRQRSTLPAVDAPDVSCCRYDIDADMNTIFEEELFTDATVAVQGRVWHVHRAILASATPILKNAFLCGTPQFLPHPSVF